MTGEKCITLDPSSTQEIVSVMNVGWFTVQIRRTGLILDKEHI